MKLELYFKYFCFGFAGFTLFLIYSDLMDDKTAIEDYLGNIGLLLVCIEMGVLMSYEHLTAEVTLKKFFSKNKSLFLSPVGVFAHTLGKIGCVLLVIDLAISFT